MPEYLQLVLNPLIVTFPRGSFLDEHYPRVRAETESPQRSAAGTFVGFGRAYEDPYLWNFNAIISPDIAAQLDALYWEHQYLRRNQQIADILLIDTTQRLQERTPRTRAIVPGTTERAIGGTHVSYFAQFWVWFSRPPELAIKGSLVGCSIALEEVSRKVPSS